MSTQGLLERSNGYYFQTRMPKQYLSHYPEATIYEKLILDKLPVDNHQETIKLVDERWAERHKTFERIDSTGSLFKSTPLALEADNLIGLTTIIHQTFLTGSHGQIRPKADIGCSHFFSSEASNKSIGIGLPNKYP